MEGKKNSFIVYTDWIDMIMELNDESRGKLFLALMMYESGEKIPDLDYGARVAFAQMRRQLQKDDEKYQETLKARQNAGKSGGRPKTQELEEKANAFSEKQTKAKKANAFSEKQTKAKKANAFSEKQTKAKKPDNDNVNDNVNDKKIKKSFAPDDAPASPCAGSFILNDGTFYEITENDVDTYQQLYPGIDVRQEIRSITAWCLSNPTNRKTRSGAKRFLNAWLNRSQNQARAKPPDNARGQPTKFSNFSSSREYNMTELERKLLGLHERGEV